MSTAICTTQQPAAHARSPVWNRHWHDLVQRVESRLARWQAMRRERETWLALQSLPDATRRDLGLDERRHKLGEWTRWL